MQSNFRVTKVPQNFIYPVLKDEDYRFGSNQLVGKVLRENGDWRDYLPPEEDQNIRGIESSACFIEASQHTIATIEEEQLEEPDNNYSARFSALLSGGTPNGGDPLKGGDSMRHDGLVKDSSMPFGDNITSWEDFHSFKGVDETAVRSEGKRYLEGKKLGYDVVVEKHYPVATKYLKLKESLKYSPCPVSVSAWYEKDGIYYKPEGLQDNHLVELVYIDPDNHPFIRDTYAPYMKKLEANYNFDFAMRWSVEKITETPQQTQQNALWVWLAKMIAWITGGQKQTMPEIPKEILPETQPIPETTAHRIIAEAEHWLNQDPTPGDEIPDEVSCVYSLVKVIRPVIALDTKLVSTIALNESLKQNKLFKPTLTPKAGNIIIAVTKGNQHGHCGIFLTDTRIASNNSFGGVKGLWTSNYSFESWSNYFKSKGLKTTMYEPV